MELFQLIKTKPVIVETLLVFREQASVSEILCLNRTKFVFDKITGLFQYLLIGLPGRVMPRLGCDLNIAPVAKAAVSHQPEKSVLGHAWFGIVQ